MDNLIEKTHRILASNMIELHYHFNDNTHSMDAIIQNKCEREFLSIIKEVAKTLEIEIVIETEPCGEGGIRRWFKLISKNENKSAVITTALIISLVTTLVITPLSSTIEASIKAFIEYLLEDEELKTLEKEKIQEEIINLKLDSELKRQQISENNVVIKRRSNFYDVLNSCDKIEQVSFVIEDKTKQPVANEISVKKKDFERFVLTTDELEPIIIEEAIIEIISPVLKKGKYKWKGIYNGEPLDFNMKSNEFKTLVQSGVIEFKNGSAIKCRLEVERKIDNRGEEKNTSYNILDVSEYFGQGTFVSMPKKKRSNKGSSTELGNLTLFSDSDFE